MKRLFLHNRPTATPAKKSGGFTIFFATLVTSLALAIGLAIYDLTARELDLSATANQSQYAIYAADTGAECVLYWDTHCTLGGCNIGSAFPTSSQSTYPASGVICNSQDVVAAPWTLQTSATGATTTISLSFPPQPYCATVTVEKFGSPTRTVVTSHGYNTCAQGAPGRLERALQVSY